MGERLDARCRGPVAAACVAASGPVRTDFADGVAHGLPAAISLAAEDSEAGGTLVSTLGSQIFRPYYTEDVTGVSLGGAIKNAIGLVAGCD